MTDYRSVMAAAASLDTDIADRQALATAENLDDVGSGDLARCFARRSCRAMSDGRE